jgi:hypothetical protein
LTDPSPQLRSTLGTRPTGISELVDIVLLKAETSPIIAGMTGSTAANSATGLTTDKGSVRRHLQPERVVGDWGEIFYLNEL